jgi:hypothetical protein
MYSTLRPYVTSGIVIVGASVLVVTPITVPPPDLRSAATIVAVETTSFARDTAGSVAGLLPSVGDAGEITATLQVILDGFRQSGGNVTGFAERAPALIQAGMEEAPASLIDQLTEAFATVVGGIGQSAASVSQWIGGAPAGVIRLIEAVIANPAVLPNVISSLLHSVFEMPDATSETKIVAMRQLSLLASVVVPIVDALDQTLPAPLGTGDRTPGLIATGAQLVYRVINGALAFLPPVYRDVQPEFGPAARQPSPLDQFTADFNDVVSALGDSAQGVINWFGAVPGRMMQLASAVFADPTRLLNAISTVVYSLVGLPDVRKVTEAISIDPGVRAPASLLGAAITPILRSLDRVLPAPFGSVDETPGLIVDFTRGLAVAINSGLRLLPPPIELRDGGSGGGEPHLQADVAEKSPADPGVQPSGALNTDPVVPAKKSRTRLVDVKVAAAESSTTGSVATRGTATSAKSADGTDNQTSTRQQRREERKTQADERKAERAETRAQRNTGSVGAGKHRADRQQSQAAAK